MKMLGKQLGTARRAAGHTQTALADLVRVDEETIASIEQLVTARIERQGILRRKETPITVSWSGRRWCGCPPVARTCGASGCGICWSAPGRRGRRFKLSR